jgi:hypothetical protein
MPRTRNHRPSSDQPRYHAHHGKIMKDLGWSHPGRLRSEAAFASLAGAAPIPASSGLTNRYRLNPKSVA